MEMMKETIEETIEQCAFSTTQSPPSPPQSLESSSSRESPENENLITSDSENGPGLLRRSSSINCAPTAFPIGKDIFLAAAAGELSSSDAKSILKRSVSMTRTQSSSGQTLQTGSRSQSSTSLRTICNNKSISESPSKTNSIVIEEINRGKWRNRHLHKHFEGEIPGDQICIADFSCALDRKGILRQGRLYFTNLYAAFHSPIGPTKLLIHVSDINRVTPKSNLLFPTSIHLEAHDGTIYNLTSFIFRNNALNSFGVLMFGWKSRMKSIPALVDLPVHESSSGEDDASDDEEAGDQERSSIDTPSLQLDDVLRTQATNTTDSLLRVKNRKQKRFAAENAVSQTSECSLVYMSAIICVGLMVLNLLVYIKSTSLILA